MNTDDLIKALGPITSCPPTFFYCPVCGKRVVCRMEIIAFDMILRGEY
jgi:hypothetical protein